MDQEKIREQNILKDKLRELNSYIEVLEKQVDQLEEDKESHKKDKEYYDDLEAQIRTIEKDLNNLYSEQYELEKAIDPSIE